MINPKILASAAVMAIAGFAGTANAATTFTDGNFNMPAASDPFHTYNAGDSFGAGSPSPWTVTSGSVDEIGNYWQAPPTGGNSVDLDGNAPGAIQQTFNASAGAYNLQFYLSGNPDGSPTTKEVTVTIGGVSQNFFYTLSGDKTNMNFILEHLVFTSTGGSDILSFASQDTNSPYGPVVGGISISAVPEPATWTMLILGFGAIGWMLRGNRRKQNAIIAA